MKIELYLRDLMQEFPDAPPSQPEPTQSVDPAHNYVTEAEEPKRNWAGQWPKQDWIGKWPKQDWIGKWPKQDWIGKWPKQDWIGQTAKQEASSGDLKDESVLPPRLFVRLEAFGSLIFDPATGRVFKADHEATGAVQAILRGQPVDETAAALQLDPTVVRQAVTFLAEHISGDPA